MVEMERRKNFIIQEAQKLFAQFGFFKTTVNEIAKAARMGKATVYHYFQGKEEVFKEVIEREDRLLNEKIRECVEKEDTPQKKLRAFVLTRIKYLNKLENIYAALKNDFIKNYAFVKKIREKDFNREMEIVKKILKQGKEQSIFDIQDLDSTSFIIISALKGLEYPWSVKVPSSSLEKKLDDLMELLFFGIVKRKSLGNI